MLLMNRLCLPSGTKIPRKATVGTKVSVLFDITSIAIPCTTAIWPFAPG